MLPVVLTCLSLAAGGSVDLAGQPLDDTWAALDREIDSLSASLAPEDQTGPKIWGYVRVAEFWSDVGTGNDQLGTVVANARLNLTGKVGDFTYLISMDGASEPAIYPPAPATFGAESLRDAWGSVPLNENIKLQFGRNKTPFLFTEMIGEQKQIFWDRTFQGAVWTGRDTGVQVAGNFEHVRAWGQVMNGGDGVADDLFWNVLAAYDLVAGKGLGAQEGGYGVDAETNFTVAAGYLDEGTLGDAYAWNGQLVATMGPFYVQGEIVNYGDDFTPGAVPVGPGAAPANANLGGTTGWDLTAAWMFDAKWEAAARYQDLDVDDTQIISLGLNWFVDAWNVQWMLNYDHVSSDVAAAEADRVLVGMVVVF